MGKQMIKYNQILDELFEYFPDRFNKIDHYGSRHDLYHSFYRIENTNIQGCCYFSVYLQLDNDEELCILNILYANEKPKWKFQGPWIKDLNRLFEVWGEEVLHIKQEKEKKEKSKTDKLLKKAHSLF